jgi:hypothetical protein
MASVVIVARTAGTIDSEPTWQTFETPEGGGFGRITMSNWSAFWVFGEDQYDRIEEMKEAYRD